MKIVNMKKVDTAFLQTKIQRLQKSIEGYCFNKQHDDNVKKFRDVLFELMDRTKKLTKKRNKQLTDEYNRLSYSHVMECDRDQLKKYTQTLAIDCYQIETDYVLTDGQVYNPSGYSLEDKVFSFLDATTAVAVNKPPKNTNLNCFDLRNER